MNRTRGKPPAGTYVGKLLEPVQYGQREGKNGLPYQTGDALVEVKGGEGAVRVDGQYEFTMLTFDALDFFRDLRPGDVFVFTVYTEKGYGRLSGMKTEKQLEDLLSRMEEKEDK